MSAPYMPVSPEDLARLHELGAAEQSLQQQLYDLELAKIPIIAAGKRVREEQDSVYKRIATDRGLPARTLLNVNMKTGEIRVLGGQPEGAAVAPPEAPRPAEEAVKAPAEESAPG